MNHDWRIPYKMRKYIAPPGQKRFYLLSFSTKIMPRLGHLYFPRFHNNSEKSDVNTFEMHWESLLSL
jgi:hypothetical protein